MPNVMNENGLQIVTQAELYSTIVTEMQGIYGTDITVTSDSPDGQFININIQSTLDTAELVMQVNAQFDPNQAIGVNLDQRCAINGIERLPGTYTTTPVTITNTVSINLYGLDQTAQAPFTVSDAAGNSYFLITTQLGLAAGANILEFRAALPGAITPVPNTITIQVTIVLGITTINNPTTYTTLGTNEESDAALRIRRQKSVSQPSQGYLAGLFAGLENISGMVSVQIHENKTDSTDSTGTPSHTIWVIVSGTAAASSIAQAIYVYRNAGCGLRGDESYDITQIDGTTFIVNWDDVIYVNLFIAFTVTSLNGINPPNVDAIRQGLVTSFVPGVDSEVNINALATQVQIIDSNTLVTNAGFSTGQTQILTLSGVAASGAFVINYNGNVSSSIAWNDSISTIQTKVRAITGLSTANVTGSIASQTLTFDLTALSSVGALIFVSTNTLQTSAPAAITFSYNEGYAPLLSPSSLQYQFVVASENIVIIPILLTPSVSQIAPAGTQTFIAYGGYGAYTYSLSVNNSGGSINSSTGLYTAGATPNVIDTVKVTDVLGNTKTVDVTVT